MKTFRWIALSATLMLAPLAHAEEAAPEPAAFDLSAVEWVTNMDDPPIGSPEAQRGGTFTDYMMGFPKTFRLHGPNSNEAFANWNRAYAIDIGLVWRHPTTDNYIPILATH
jgi:microcin C transport system substrate-binding protein